LSIFTSERDRKGPRGRHKTYSTCVLYFITFG